MLLVPSIALAFAGSLARPSHAKSTRSKPVAPLVRVDRQHSLDRTHVPRALVEVPPSLGLPDRRLDPLALAYFAELSDEVWRRFGRRLIISSGYRSHGQQRDLFRRYTQDGVRSGLGRKRARKLANTYSALPGHSEHQLGTTIDIRDQAQNHLLRGPDKDPRLQRWLRRNAHRYGFVNSYPPGRRDPRGRPYRSATYRKTGYIVEPWHWRFVGKRAALHHHRLEKLAGRRITTHEFMRRLSKRRRLRRKLARPHPDDRRVLRRLQRRLRTRDRTSARRAPARPTRRRNTSSLALSRHADGRGNRVARRDDGPYGNR